MAHIFKHPAGSHKGILIFTHKEWGFFSGNKVMRKIKREYPIAAKFLPDLRPPYRNAIASLKSDYFIGVHIGCYYPHKFSAGVVDFVLSGNSNLPNLSTSIIRIPFNSREFTPTLFARDDTQKMFDVMTVAQNVKVKNYDKLFNSIKACLAVRPASTFLIICPSQQGVKFGVHADLADLFYATFSREEQANIAFFYLHPQLEWGLPQSQLARFYRLARVFTLFSSQEGESRVISEALCSGLPVVVYEQLLGGGKDLLNRQNSRQFASYEQAHDAWIQALDDFPNGSLEASEQFTREDYSLARLHGAFAELYESAGQSYDSLLINTDHLDRRLPGHHYDVAWRRANKPTADILSRSQFDLFLEQLKHA